MSNTTRKIPRTNDNNANETSHYVVLIIAIIIGVVGTFIRFVQDTVLFSSIGNILLVIGTIIAIRIVFKILK